MEGVERYKVKLIKHNEKWHDEFLEVKRELEKVWKDNVLEIQHVGSTAVKAIYAKPILDVAVKLNSIEDLDIAILKSHGYSYCGFQDEDMHRVLFVLRDENNKSLRHIHCYDKDEEGFNLLVCFRDYLNEHPKEALKYEELKLELAKRYKDNRIMYTKGKEEFIKGIYKKICNQ